MATPGDFVQSNKRLSAPDGREETVMPLSVFTDGRQTVSCWCLSDGEVAEVVRTRQVFVNVCYPGGTQPPIYVWAGALREGLF